VDLSTKQEKWQKNVMTDVKSIKATIQKL